MHRLKKPLFLIWFFHVKLFQYLGILVLSLALITVVLSAILTGMLYYANQYGYLQQWINRGLDPIHITYEEARVSWHHADPRLALSGITISDPEVLTEPVKIGAVSVDFGLWSSLLHWNLVTDSLTVSGLNLQVQQQKNGRFKLVGLKTSDASTKFELRPEVAKWLLDQNGFYFNDIGLALLLHNGQTLTLHVNALNWEKRFGYSLALDGSIAEIPNSRINAGARLRYNGDPLHWQNWQANFEGLVSGKDFTPLFGKQSFYDLAWMSGGGEVNFKGHIAQGILAALNADIALNDINLTHFNIKNIFEPQFNEIISWRAKPDGSWQISAQTANNTNTAVPNQLTLAYQPNQQFMWQLAAQNINFAMIAEWIEFWFPPTDAVVKAWQAVAPAGMIKNLNIAANKSSGSVTLDADPFKVGKTEVFPDGWPTSTLALAGSWNMPSNAAGTTEINITQFSLVNNWLKIILSGSLSVLDKTPANPNLNLSGTISGQNLEQVKANYIPEHFVSEGLSSWLTQGLVKIPQVSGKFAVRGKLDDIPYGANNGLFEIALHADNAVIEPWEGWPLISNISADLLFKNQKFTIDSNQAQTLQVPVHNVHFEISDLRPHKIKEIIVTGAAEPTGAQGLNYLASMPILDKSVSQWLRSIEVSGKLPVRLKITIPLEEHEPVVAAGNVVLQGNNWSLEKGGSPLLSNIRGTLRFRNDTIAVKQVRFNALDQNLKASIPGSPIDHLRVVIDSFAFLGATFDNLQMDVVAQSGQTVLQFQHPLVKGNLTITENGSLLGRFSEFHLPVYSAAAPTSGQANSGGVNQTVDINQLEGGNEGQKNTPLLLGATLTNIPPLALTITQLYYGDNTLGEFYWQSQPVKNGIDIQHLNLTGAISNLNAQGLIRTIGGQDRFAVNGRLESGDYGTLLKNLAYPGLVSGGNGDIEFNLKWMGVLLDVNRASINGTVSFNIKNGKLLKVNTGFARIFGLVSLDTIFSAVSFNFQKMLSSGLAFDILQGSYTLTNGIATAGQEGLRIAGPSLSMVLKGQMDLVNQTLNQTATVMPQVGNSIAVAAAVVGGPVAGVATWFADKLLSNTILRNAGVNLKITGPFNDPKVSVFKSAVNS